MRTIKLTQGKVALVDDGDYEYLNQWKWCAVYFGKNWYAERKNNLGITIRMHKLIMNTPKGMVTDHIDHDGLNNQRENLRVCTHKQNMMNNRIRNDNKSGYKGVCWSQGKWKVEIMKDQKHIHIGMFDDKILAAQAYDNKAKELFGEFAVLNFPDSNQSLR